LAGAGFTRIELDVTHVLPAIRVPTLVVAKERFLEPAEEVAEAIPGAELTTVPGRGGAFFENDFAVEAVEAFLEGAPRGSGIRFADRGPRELKGIPGEWRIYSVVDD
jgi:pimeloyl-ACP methyl ester carboxylesterase